MQTIEALTKGAHFFKLQQLRMNKFLQILSLSLIFLSCSEKREPKGIWYSAYKIAEIERGIVNLISLIKKRDSTKMELNIRQE